MVWLPDWQWRQQQQKGGAGKGSKGTWQPQWQKQSWGKGDSWGKGSWGKGSWGKGKGKGKGGLTRDPTKKVWIGNIPEEATWKDLQTHMNQVGATTWAQIFKEGTGAVAYKTAEEAATAIATMNGTLLGSSAIVCDAWEQKPKE
mmetsp:Transcript_18786/g.41019  ORF Transcript_18786/g.41019 Transcript_18786/m.41019 type:complete len:144 (+) Transcript_18786:52-483(+)